MKRRSRRVATSALLGIALTITGCTSNSNDNKDYPTGRDVGNAQQSVIPPADKDPAQSNGAVTPPKDENGGQFCDDPELAGGKYDAYCNGILNDTPWYDTDVMTYYPGHTPHSTKYAGEVNVESFLLGAMRSQRDIWRLYINDSKVQLPSFDANIVTGTEKFKSACPIGVADATVTVTATSARALYCPGTQTFRDQIALPASTIGKIWKGRDRKTADMAVAIVASRAGALSLNRALARAGSGSVTDPYFGASCLAGVWARGAYPRSAASDFDRALRYAHDVTVEIGNDTDPDIKMLDEAWYVGYNSALAGTCSDAAAGWNSDQLKDGDLTS